MSGLRVSFACRSFVCLWLLLTATAFHLLAAADPVPPEPPKVLLSSPLAIAASGKTKVTIRGWRLQDATDVKVAGGKIATQILSKGAASIPDKYDAKKVGDQQIEFEVTVPAGFSEPITDIVVIAPAGSSQPQPLLVGGPAPILSEQEPNDGFRQAQPIAVPQIVDGVIHTNQNVDVYRFAGTAGQCVVIDVAAARFGSLLDPILTIYNADGRLVASQDDESAEPASANARDPRTEFTLPATGAYFIAIQDAHDRGTALHIYRLTVRPVK